MKQENKQNLIILFLYIFLFLLILIPGIKGIGNYWDWAFPYFQDQTGQIFLKNMNSWSDISLGNTMSYNSSYYFYFVLYLLSYLKISTEILLYIILVLSLSFSSFFSYLIIKKYVSGFLLYLLPLAVVFNSAFLYKLVAGHLAYVVSFVSFVYIIYYLLNVFKGRYQDYVIFGLLLAFSGIQIQFFMINILVFIVFVVYNKKLFNVGFFLQAIAIAFLINLPWLSNFIVGANSVSDSGEYAILNQFPGLSQANPLWIITFLFSKATIIKYFYPIIVYPFFGLIYLALLYMIFTKSRIVYSKDNKFSLTFGAIILILSTGVFWYINYYPINLLFPMFREIGHFAPIAAFSVFLVSAVLLCKEKFSKNRLVKTSLSIYLIIFIGINVWGFIQHLPKNDFASARGNFNDFKKAQDQKFDSGRILFYPFFGQYGFVNEENKYSKDYLMNNSGWDSFSMYSDDYIENYSSFNSFKDSIEYKFIKEYDLEKYAYRGVEYIYDFSDIYESNFERYVEPEVYDNDLSLIKNDPDFFQNVIENNPGEVERVSDKILKIVNYKPRINGENVSFKKINPTKYKIYIKNIKKVQDLEFVSNFHKDWKLYLKENPNQDWCGEVVETQLGVTECQKEEDNIILADIGKLSEENIFDDSHKKSEEFGHVWKIDPEYIKDNFDQSNYKINDDGSIDIELELYFKPQSYYLIGLILSILTIIGTSGYLITSWAKKQKTNK